MPKKKAKSKAKDGRKRARIAVNFSPDEMADIKRQVPSGQRATYCRNAILFPLRSPDPVIDVGAKLLAMTATMKRFDKLSDELKIRLDADFDRACATAEENDDGLSGLLAKMNYENLSELLTLAASAAQNLLKEAALMRRHIAERQERSVSTPRVEKRPKP